MGELHIIYTPDKNAICPQYRNLFNIPGKRELHKQLKPIELKVVLVIKSERVDCTKPQDIKKYICMYKPYMLFYNLKFRSIATEAV